MRNSSSMAGRLFDDDASPSEPAASSSEILPRLPPSPSSGPPEPGLPPLRPAQHACYEALSLALKEGHVFAALTGPDGAGKTMVLEAVLADRRDRALRCIRITDPDKVPAALAAQIEQVAYAETSKPENLGRHIVLAIDDAHTASDDLLRCLARLASMREPGRRVPQILLVGHTDLWSRLTTEEYEPLVRRLAIRAVLPAAEADTDPWASVEAEVTQTMSQLRSQAERLPVAPAARLRPQADAADFLPPPNYEYRRAHGIAPDVPSAAVGADAIPPASMFALFPNPPQAAFRPAIREPRRRLLMPLVSLFAGLAAVAFALSFYDWPELLPDMPWVDAKPATPFVIPRSPQAQSFSLPLPPAASTGSPAPASVAAAAAPARAPAAPETPAPVVVATTAPISPSLVTQLLRRGDEQVALGDISAARPLFERAAETGSGLAARQLARTYDPAFLPSAVRATLADPGKAIAWYRRAAALGNTDAAARLQALNDGR